MAETWVRRILVVFGVLFGVFLLSGCLPAPQQFVVTSTADAVDGAPGDGVCATATGECTLRAAVMEANEGDDRVAVVLQPQTYHLTLAGSDEDGGATGDLDVHRSVQIVGRGAVIDGDALDRVFDLHGGSVELLQLTVQRGSVAGDGGGIRNHAAGLHLHEAAVVGNSASGAGGGLFNGTSAGVVNASFFDNTAGANLGGGAANGPTGQLIVVGTTITGNRAGDAGGGLASFSAAATNRLQIGHSIVTGNGTLADGTASDCATSGGPGLPATIESWGFNFESGTSCDLVATGDGRGDPQLGAMVVQDGTPPFRRLLPGSPLIDAIAAGTDRCQGGADQRGMSRPQGPGCDIGSVEVATNELEQLSLVVDTALDTADATPGDRVCADGSGACSLRAAVMETNAFPTADTIVIAPGVDPNLAIGGRHEDQSATGDLDISDDLTLDGRGALVQANGIDRVLDVQGGVDVRIDHTTLTGGHALMTCGQSGGGAGLRNDIGNVTITRSTLSQNLVSGSNWAQGGGLSNRAGQLRVHESSIVENSAEVAPCAASGGTTQVLGGGVYNAGQLEIRRSTLYGNRALSVGLTRSGAGGAVFNDRGTAAVVASTIARNQADSEGSGITSVGFGGAGELTIRGTLLAANRYVRPDGGPGDDNACGVATVLHPSYQNAITSTGYNIATNGGCPFAPPFDRVANFATPLLADNGGPTPTVAIAPDAPAVDVIPVDEPGLCDDALTHDQRGESRPVNTTGGDIARCDVGAVELAETFAPMSWTVDSAADEPDANVGDGQCSIVATGSCTLRAAVQEANAWPATDLITVPEDIDIVLTVPGTGENAAVRGDLDITDDVTIDGQGAVVSGGSLDRVFEVRAAGLSLTNMTVRGGVPGGPGGGILNDGGTLTLANVTVTANQGTAGGGVRNLDYGVFTAINTTVSGNEATSAGAAISNAALGIVDLRFTTISDNVSGNGDAVAVAGVVRASSSIIEAQSLGIACSAALASDGGNVASDTSCGLTDLTDRQGVDPRVGPLADNGGWTPTHVPLGGSPAIDLVAPESPACSSTNQDQRGTTRPTGSGCDAGSVERPAVGPLSLTVAVPSDTVDALPGDGICADELGVCSLRAAVLEANAWPGPDTITIAPGVDPQLAREGTGDTPEIGDIDVLDGVRIVGDGAVVSTAPGWDSRVLQFGSTSRGSGLEGLTVTGGDSSDAGGGVRTAAGLTIRNTTVVGNRSGGSGGGIYATAPGSEVDPSSWVQLENSTISGNTATGTGGGLTGASGSYVSLVHTTITANASGSGGAIGGPGPKRAFASVVAAQSAGADCTAPITSLSYNVSSDTTCGFTAAGDAQAVDARLGPLLMNGGPTRTHLPRASSPTIDRIPAEPACPIGTDQRGSARPSGSGCDSGAVERQPSDLLQAEPRPPTDPPSGPKP
jgi:CSLREA domain-containing protein